MRFWHLMWHLLKKIREESLLPVKITHAAYWSLVKENSNQKVCKKQAKRHK